ncbi:MAG: hypothetical protein U0228_02695 [Myxococcaceae bacterium]
MKRTIIPLLLAVSLVSAGCVNQVQPIHINRLTPLTAEKGPCEFPAMDETAQVGSVTLDVAAGRPQVAVGLEVTGTSYSAPGVRVTNVDLEPKGGGAPVLKEMVVTYRLSRRIGAQPKPFHSLLLLSFAPGTSELLARGPVPLLSDEIGQLLTDGLTGSATLDDSVDVLADIEVLGEITNSKQPITTGTVTLPIHVVKSLPTTTCTPPQVFQRFPFKAADANMTTDTCHYIGQTYWKFGSAPVPSVCCNPGDEGC